MRRTARPAGLSEEDLRAVARLEGRPLPRGGALADVLGLNSTAAWALVRRLRRQGVLALVSPARRRPGACDCITYVQVLASRLDELDALEARFVADAAVLVAARITGRFDYRLVSRHSDYRTASNWSRALEAVASVSHVKTRICDTVIDRPQFAAAILGSEPS